MIPLRIIESLQVLSTLPQTASPRYRQRGKKQKYIAFGEIKMYIKLWYKNFQKLLLIQRGKL